MLRTAYWIIYFWCYLLIKTPKLKKIAKIEDFEKRREYVRILVRDWARKLVFLAGANVTVTGEENLPNETAVFVANHQGNFDVPLMLGFVGSPRALIAKIEMEKMPLVSSWMRYLECIFVDRNNSKQSLKAVIEAIKYVKAGNSLTIFPEGTRSKGDKIGEFKSGSTTIALKANAVIVPVTIDGSYKLLEKNKGFKITPADVKITIHKPVSPCEENIDEKIKNIIESGMKK